MTNLGASKHSNYLKVVHLERWSRYRGGRVTEVVVVVGGLYFCCIYNQAHNKGQCFMPRPMPPPSPSNSFVILESINQICKSSLDANHNLTNERNIFPNMLRSSSCA